MIALVISFHLAGCLTVLNYNVKPVDITVYFYRDECLTIDSVIGDHHVWQIDGTNNSVLGKDDNAR